MTHRKYPEFSRPFRRCRAAGVELGEDLEGVPALAQVLEVGQLPAQQRGRGSRLFIRSSEIDVNLMDSLV